MRGNRPVSCGSRLANKGIVDHIGSVLRSSHMAVELDHIFIFTTIGAPGAACLLQSGLTEGAPNIHPGQGTAYGRFFFHNAYLELLGHDAGKARSEQA